MAEQLYLSGMGFENFVKLIDALYDEVLIYDNNYRIVYINQASVRHYGCEPWQMIGKYFSDFTKDYWWNNSVLPIVYQTKKAYAARQKTKNGSELLTIAIPVFGEDKELKYVVMNVRDTINETDLYYKDYNSQLAASDAMDEEYVSLCYTKKNADLIKKTLKKNVPYLIVGEDGTGKKQLARYIHQQKKENKPLLFLNTAASEMEIERALFGYVKMDAVDMREDEGLLKTCGDGTVLIDEVSDLPLAVQQKLADVLETGSFTPLNSRYRLPFHGTIIATTIRNLPDMISRGLFVRDLYYQLSVVELYIPSLMQRTDSIRPLIQYYLRSYSQKYKVTRQMTEEAMEILESYNWSGNLRELQTTVERLVVTTENITVDIGDLPKRIYDLTGELPGTLCGVQEGFDEKMERYKAYLVGEAYKKCGSSRKVAEYLNISQTRANNLLRIYVRNR